MGTNAKELSKMQLKLLPIVKKIRNMLGYLPDGVQFRLMIAGPPYSGKSSVLIKIMNLLANQNFGYEALYGNFEEKKEIGTLTNKLRATGVRNPNITFLDNTTLEEFYKELDTGRFKFAVIDSLSVVAGSLSETKELFTLLEKRYPTIPMFFVVHFTKKGQYFGSAWVEHMVDISLRVKDGVLTTEKNRFLRNGKLPTIKIWDL